MRDSVVVHESKHEVVLIALLRKDLDDVMVQLAPCAAAEKSIGKLSRFWGIYIKERGTTSRIVMMRRNIRMSCTMKLVIDGKDAGFLLPQSLVASKRLAAVREKIVKASNIRLLQHNDASFALERARQLSKDTSALYNEAELPLAFVRATARMTSSYDLAAPSHSMPV